MSAHRIFIIDRYPVVCLGLRSLLDHANGFDFCGQACSPNAALQEFAEADPDLAVVGLLPGRDGGLGLVQMLAQRSHRARILVFSTLDEGTYAQRALAAGAAGYLMKNNRPDLVLCALKRIQEGGIYLSDRMTAVLLESFHRTPKVSNPVLGSVTNRELQVLQLIGEGNTTGQIARSLGLSPKTVGTHRENLKNKLAAKSGIDLITKAVSLAKSGAL